MVDFALPAVYSRPDGWGPPPDSEHVEGLHQDAFNFAYEHLDKYPLPRSCRICDFTMTGLKYQELRVAKGKGSKGKGKGMIQMLSPSKDDEGFALVDRLPTKTFSRGRGFGFGRGNKGRGKGLQSNYQEGILGQNKKQPVQNQFKGKGKGNMRGGQQRRNQPSFKEWSVEQKTEWELMREIGLSDLSKLQIDHKDVKVEDVLWCGELSLYDKAFDKIEPRSQQSLKRFEDLNFYNITAKDDPHLLEFMEEPEVQVIATDHVLAALAAAAQSVYSWDIVITKLGGKVAIDKRDGSHIDMVAVNETSPDPPSNEDKEHMNSATKLSQEAGCINQNFSQMVLDYNVEAEQMERPDPFMDEEDEGRPASFAYRYRKFTLPGNSRDANEFKQQPLTMIVRTTVNCKMPGEERNPRYVSLNALNEYDPKDGYSWRQQLATKPGMVIISEMRNNAFKVGRWTAQAILAGCDIMKIGYVSRAQANKPYDHSMLLVQTYRTDTFAEQITMNRNNIFGIIRSIVDMVADWEDGTYVLIKDPMRPQIRTFKVPMDAFVEEEEEEAEQDEEDDHQEYDEHGNIAPSQPVGLLGQ